MPSSQIPYDFIQLERSGQRLTIVVSEAQSMEVFRTSAVCSLLWRCNNDFASVIVDIGDGRPPVAGRLTFCTNGPGAFLIPDVEFILNRGYDELRNLQAVNLNSWRERSDDIVWRGTTTGGGAIFDGDLSAENTNLRPRLRMCLMLKNHVGVDARFSGVCQVSDIPAVQERLSQEGLFGIYIRQLAWFGKKFAIDIDGNSNAWSGLFSKLMMGCCVIKVASQGGFFQWYYDRLEPWVHYVPVRADMADLIEKIEWCRSHLDESEAIAHAGQDLVLSMTFDREMDLAVAKLQTALSEGALSSALPEVL